MTGLPKTALEGGLSIAEVERDSGVAADTLRVWERRYGFPRPLRDGRGARLYPKDQVETLRVLGRLVAAGHRPNRIVGQSLETLRALSPVRSPRRGAKGGVENPEKAEDLKVCLDVLREHDAVRFSEILTRRMMGDGLAAFVTGFVAPLIHAVGEAWARGELEIFEEHLCTEEMTRILRFGIRSAATRDSLLAGRPRVLLTTVPGERHTLGLLMAEAMLVLAGCSCVALGPETPLADIALAARAHGADVVALSFSGHTSPRQVREALAALAAAAPDLEIWAGGADAKAWRAQGPRLRTIASLDLIAEEVASWRAERTD